MSILGRIVGMVFGPDEPCDHGLTASEGVCMDCCNDAFATSEDEDAEVVDFAAYRDTI